MCVRIWMYLFVFVRMSVAWGWLQVITVRYLPITLSFSLFTHALMLMFSFSQRVEARRRSFAVICKFLLSSLSHTWLYARTQLYHSQCKQRVEAKWRSRAVDCKFLLRGIPKKVKLYPRGDRNTELICVSREDIIDYVAHYKKRQVSCFLFLFVSHPLSLSFLFSCKFHLLSYIQQFQLCLLINKQTNKTNDFYVDFLSHRSIHPYFLLSLSLPCLST
jgi:hypothetical protein